MRSLRFVAQLLPLACLWAALASHAQQDRFSLYALSSNTFVPNAFRGSQPEVVLPGVSSYAPVGSPGFGLGAAVRLFNAGPFTVDLDLRESIGIGSQSADFLLGGFHIASRRYHHRLRPFAQISYGILTTSLIAAPVVQEPCIFLPCATPGTDSTDETYRGYEIFAGADYRLSRHFDLRALEIGIGDAVAGPQYTSVQNTTVFNVDSGLLVHF